MKISPYLLLIVWTTLSLHATNHNVEIMPLSECVEYKDAVITLFRQEFPKADLPDSLKHKKASIHEENIDVILQHSTATASAKKRTDKPTLCGFAIYNKIASERVEDITRSYEYTLPQNVCQTFKIINLDFIAIKKEFQNKGYGYGSKLIDHLEKTVIDDHYDYITLESTLNAHRFYNKKGYLATSLADSQHGPKMVKPLNLVASTIVGKILSKSTDDNT